MSSMTSLHNQNNYKSYTESQSITFVQDIMLELSELQESVCFNKIHPLFRKLTCAYNDLSSHRSAISKKLTESGFVPLSVKFISRCHKQGYFLNENIWLTTRYAIYSVWKFSDESRDIANEIIRTGLPKLLISHILHKPYTTSLKSNKIYSLIESSLGIIHNIVRSSSIEDIPKLDEFKLELVTLIRRNNSDRIGIVSMLTLACLVKENELHLLDEGKNTIKILLKNIEIALKNENKRINGVAIWELLNGLNRISVNDNLKETIIKENGISTITDILKSSTSENDIEKCLSILWNLSFNKNIKSFWNNNFNLQKMVNQFKNHKSSKIRKNCEGTLWLINEENENRNSLHLLKSISQEDLKFDAFISYSWNNKQTILKIVDELKKININLWIDDDQMSGSTLESMANGIESSKVFLMAISEAYRFSPTCRTEAEYAFSLKKPIIPLIVETKYKPTGWLGLIMGSKTYYEFSERRNFFDSISRLAKDINIVLGNVEEIIIEKKVCNIEAINSKDKNNKPGSRKILSFINWSNKEVEEWLVKNDLGKLKNHFSNINGKLLASMIDLNSKSPQFLYETLKFEYGMNLLDILRFKAAAEELISCQIDI